jgi:cytochrome c oxidase assembly factor CtaG
MTSLAGGYTGPPDLTITSGLTSWTFDAGAFVLVALAGWAYVTGVRRVHGSGERWPTGRTVWFGAGLVALVITTMSFLGAYAHTLFWVTAAQMALLLTVVPVLLVLGGPVSLLVRAAPQWEPRVERFLGSAPLRILTFPVIGSLLVATMPFLVYYTPWFEASLRNLPMYGLLHVATLAVGLLFFWPVVSLDRPPRVHYVALTVIVLAETLFDAVPGISIWLGKSLIAADYYRSVARPWGRSMLSDQQFGGVVLWAIGELVGLPLLALVVVQWVRSDAEEAARVDRELDLADAQREAAARADTSYQGIETNGEE